MPAEHRVIREHVSFTNDRGETLRALLERPEAKPKAYALFAHCFTCSKTSSAASRISRTLALHGFAVLRFDFTGLGNSEGDFSNTNFSSNIQDLQCATRHMREHHGSVALMIGHSLGGAAVLAAAGALADAKAVVTIAAPSDPAHLRHLFRDRIEDIRAHGEATVELGGRRFTVKKQFLDDLGEHGLNERVARLRKALLVMHAPLDDVVGIDEASKIFLAAKHPKSFVSLDRADHLLNDPRDAQFVADIIGAWAARYVTAPDVEARASPPALAAGEVLVQETGAGLTNEIYTGTHRLLADEPLAAGGSDRGPDPYNLLLAGLGACTSMTLRMYARLKNLPLEHVRVTLRSPKGSCERLRGMRDEDRQGGLHRT